MHWIKFIVMVFDKKKFTASATGLIGYTKIWFYAKDLLLV